MVYGDIRDPERQEEAVAAITDVYAGRMNRAQFVKRAAAVGLSGGVISSVLAACGGSSSTGTTGSGGSTTGGGGGGGTSVADLQKIVYPQGFTSTPAVYKGPNAGGKLAYLPPDYHSGTTPEGIWKWKFEDFKASKPYRVALAVFSSKWDLMVESEERFKRFAQQAGFTVDVFDNNFDADQAIKNANTIAQQHFDFVIEEQQVAPANETIDGIFKGANIPVIYFAVPGPEGALFMDTGNYRMCEAAGEWLGKYARDNWDGQVDLVLDSAQPTAGVYVAQRGVGYKAGIKKILPDVPDSAFVSFDGKGLLDDSQTRAADILTSKPDAKYILGVGSNDDAGVGIVRALEAAGRAKTAAVAGQAGQASAVTELEKPNSAFKVSAFQDVQAQLWMAAIGILKAEGGDVAPVNFYPFYLTTSKNVKKFPPQAGTLTKA